MIKEYVFETENSDEVVLTLSEEGQLTMTLNFLNKVFTEEQALRFAKLCGYTLKKAPLRVVK